VELLNPKEEPVKGKLYIVVDIDTDRNAGTTHTEGEYDSSLGGWVSKIYVNKDVVQANADPLSVTAHEIGHNLAWLFQLPGSVQSPDHNPLVQMGLANPSEIDHDGKVREEAEAWDNARKMDIPIDPLTVKYSLDSYQNMGKGKPIRR
jgi:hypothetical protein